MSYPEKEIGRGVAAMASRLDGYAPGWHKKVDLNRFKITDACNCILGQTFGSYYRGCVAMDITNASFVAIEKFVFNPIGKAAQKVEEAWVREIEARRLLDGVEEIARAKPGEARELVEA